MAYDWVIPLLAAAATFALAIIVARSRLDRNLKLVFTFLAFTLVSFDLFYVVLASINDRALAFELTRVLRVGSIYLMPAIFHLPVALKEDRPPAIYAVLLMDYLLATLFVVANAFDLFVSELRPVPWGYVTVRGPFYNVLTLYAVANCAMCIATILYDYKTTNDPRTRLQLKFWLLGMAVALPLGLTNFLPVYGIPFHSLGNLGPAAWAAIVAYAIVHHRLLDIEDVLANGIAYVGVAFMLLTPASLVAVAMQRWEFGIVSFDFTVGIIALMVAVGVLFPMLRLSAKTRVERSLFPEMHESRTALMLLSKSIVRILDRDKLVSELCKQLSGILQLESIALFLREDIRGAMELKCNLGLSCKDRVFVSDDPFVQWIGGQTQPVLFGEAPLGRPPIDPRALEIIFKRNGWEVCLPLTSSHVAIGFLALGRRRDLELFAVGDLEILTAIAAEASIAFENSRLFEEVRQSRELISRASRLSALGTLAAGIAHEIRNPLVSIHTFFQLAPTRLADPEFMTSFLQLAEKEVERIGHLINELLTFARAAPAAVEEVDLNSVIERATALLQPQAQAQQIDFRFSRSLSKMMVLMDSDQIIQVLVNLMLNAIQATPSGGSVTVESRFFDDETRTYCQIEIRDTGPGVPKELWESIFNPFFTTKDRGTGLGLAIAHRIVTEAGGFITFDTVENSGSRFYLNLPALTMPARAVASGS
jgi:signal transduction histidine kinase